MITPANLVNIERALHELKCGRTIALDLSDHGILYFCSAETVVKDDYVYFQTAGGKLTLSQNRLPFSGLEHPKEDALLNLKDITYDNLNVIIWHNNATNNLSIPSHSIENATYLHKLTLQLTVAAELLPSTLCLTQEAKFSYNILTLTDNDILTFKEFQNYDSNNLTEACRTPLHLEQTNNVQIVAFRSAGTSKEHYALIIGEPTTPPLVRVHSSCYTGDLLYSITCDCKDQLHSAIDKMAKEKGGIILYLLQEGRDIGLINKLRAYALKEEGLDTVDANFALGFDDDHRHFAIAAKMLKLLGYDTINLLTNNPKKSNSLTKYGIHVTKCVPHKTKHHQHNKHYLDTKKGRMGHIF